MKYYKIEVSTNFCGTDDVEWVTGDDNSKESDFHDYASDMAYQHAEGYVHLLQVNENDEDYEEEIENFLNEANYTVTEVTREEYEEETGESGDPKDFE